jgi:hypothetical protein
MRDFVSMVVDFRGKRLMELVNRRTIAEIEASLAYIPGRENVRVVRRIGNQPPSISIRR